MIQQMSTELKEVIIPSVRNKNMTILLQARLFSIIEYFEEINEDFDKLEDSVQIEITELKKMISQAAALLVLQSN